LVDATSLLFRLQTHNIDVGDRWDELMQIWMKNIDEHIFVFNDIHLIVNAMCSKNIGAGERALESMKEYAKSKSNQTQAQITSDIGIKLGEIIINFGNTKYTEVISQLIPIRHKIQAIGGSHAQRDLFNQLLINSCFKAENYSLAQSLLSERIVPSSNALHTRKLYANSLTKLNLHTATQQALSHYDLQHTK